ncbi:MAG: diacylglycerol kinase family lipid kinase [Anaerolineae bacterium]|nr:diacylglycerol kinase family lipid kinase [Anaerolineae bacterium]
MATHLVIVNPTAGRGAAAAVLPRTTRLLKEHGLFFDLVDTERAWHAAELTQEAVAAGYRVVVALGGDGTVNEVINGLMLARQAGHGDAALGLLSIGTGNDFAYGIGAPTDLEANCTALARGWTRTVDIGYAKGYRYFGNGIGLGFDAAVNMYASRLTRLRGNAVYLAAVLRTILFYYRAPVTLIEGDTWRLERPTLMVSIMNGRRLGGGFLVAPDALPDDGLFDLCMGGKMGRLRMISLVPHFMRGTQTDKPRIVMRRSSRVRLTVRDGAQVVHADGETIATEASHLEVEILPRSLRVVY